MKKIIVALLVLAGFVVIGCEERTTRYVLTDYTPAVPQGVYSITGDGAVYLFWLPVRESDLAGYRVYRSLNDDEYYYIGFSVDETFIDQDAINGQTYFYAVSSIDESDNESELSYETVFDTPRPEGSNLILADVYSYPDIAGYDFSSYSIVAYDDYDADIYVEYLDNTFYLNVANAETDIQDMGFTESFDDISYSPTSGWSSVGWSELILGHTYIIWTSNNHYAKLRVTSISAPNSVRFDWGYQTDGGNPELARPLHEDEYLRHAKGMTIVK